MSALVRSYLRSLVSDSASQTASYLTNGETAVELRRRLLRELFADFDARGVGLHMSDNLPREELYDRDRARSEAESAHAGVTRGRPPCQQHSNTSE